MIPYFLLAGLCLLMTVMSSEVAMLHADTPIPPIPPIRIVTFCCGGHFTLFDTFILSIMKANHINHANNLDRPVPVHLIFFMDEMSRNLLSTCFHKLNTTHIQFTVYNMEDYLRPEIEALAGPRRRFACASYKLSLPEMLPKDWTHVLSLDMDVIVYKDLVPMWKEAVAQSGVMLWAALEMADVSTDGLRKQETYNLWYLQHNKTHYIRPSGINTGVMIYNLALMREANITANYWLTANDEPSPLPDQDVLNTWGYYNPTKVSILNCEWNARKSSKCFFPLIRNGRTTPEYIDLEDAPEFGGIYHGNGGILRKKKHLVDGFKNLYLGICDTRLPYPGHTGV